MDRCHLWHEAPVRLEAGFGAAAGCLVGVGCAVAAVSMAEVVVLAVTEEGIGKNVIEGTWLDSPLISAFWI